MNITPGSDDQNEFNFFEILGFLQRHLRTLSIFFILGLGIGIVYWFITPPRFRSSVLLKMNHNSKDVIGFGEEYMWNPYRDEFFETEFQIIKSSGVALKVVNLLGSEEYNHRIISKGIELKDFGDFAMGLKDETEPETDHRKIQEQRKLQAARGLLGGLSISGVRDTNLVRISYSSGSPTRSQALAQAFADAYIQYDLDMTYNKNLEAFTFLEDKAKDLQKKIDDLVKLAAKSEETSQIVTGTSAKDEDLERLKEANSRAANQADATRSAYERLISTPIQSNPDLAELPVISQLSAALAKLKNQYQSDLQTYKPQMPRMQSLKKEIEAKESLLDNELKKAYQTQVARAKSDMERAQKEYENATQAYNIARSAVSSARLSSESDSKALASQLKVMKHQLESIEYKKEEMDLALSLKSIGRSNKMIIEDAKLPSSPYAPSLKRYAVFGALGGLALAIALIFLLEVTDRKIHSAEVLERISGLPNLATIPKISEIIDNGDKVEGRKQVGLYTHLKPTSPFSEVYRHLRTNVLLSKAGENKLILVTSSVSGEGKTISSTNLSIAMAQLEKKVLLIDCDLRRPKLHKLFNLSNKIGLVNYLVAPETHRPKGQQTPVPNLHLLSAGPLPPNPAELVSSKRMQDIMHALKEDYDYIVIDSSPILAVTDALILGKMADTIIFVAKASTTLRDDYIRSLTLLAQNNLKPLGTIMNDFDYKRGKRYYGYRYGYGRYGKYYGYTPYDYQAEDA